MAVRATPSTATVTTVSCVAMVGIATPNPAATNRKQLAEDAICDEDMPPRQPPLGFCARTSRFVD